MGDPSNPAGGNEVVGVADTALGMFLLLLWDLGTGVLSCLSTTSDLQRNMMFVLGVSTARGASMAAPQF